MVHHKKAIIFSYAPQSKARVMYEENIFCSSLLLISPYLSAKTKKEVNKYENTEIFKKVFKISFLFPSLGKAQQLSLPLSQTPRDTATPSNYQSLIHAHGFLNMSYFSSLQATSLQRLTSFNCFYLSLPIRKMRTSLFTLYLPEKLAKICS